MNFCTTSGDVKYLDSEVTAQKIFSGALLIIFILRTTFGVELRKRQSVLDEEVANILYQQVDSYIFDVINILRLKLLTIQGLPHFSP